MLQLSLAKTKDDLWRILSSAIDTEVQQGVVHRSTIQDAELGYLWLRFERGDIDLATCLDLAGRHADAYDTSAECEALFDLLDRLRAGGPDAVLSEAQRLFEPFRSLAENQWIALSGK